MKKLNRTIGYTAGNAKIPHENNIASIERVRIFLKKERKRQKAEADCQLGLFSSPVLLEQYVKLD